MISYSPSLTVFSLRAAFSPRSLGFYHAGTCPTPGGRRIYELGLTIVPVVL